VQDNVTGLVWENKTDDGSIHDKDNYYNWDYAQSVFIAALNSQNFGGYSDWRLPTVIELSFIRNLGNFNPSINTGYFPNTVSSLYWLSTTYAYFPGRAWGVNFGDGYVHFDYRSNDYHVRAVRAGQCGSFGNFIDNGDGTVTNTDTGLMWQKDTAPETYRWQEALSYCENLSLADYTDWRLPNTNELQSLVDYTRYPAINTDYFPNTSSDYWSSTTRAYAPDGAWLVGFGYGDVYGYGYKPNPYYVRAVRSGQCGSFDTSTTTTVVSTTTTIQPCPTETLYGEHSEQTELLRYLRDNVLNQTLEGQEIIKLYYEWSPVIVETMNEDEEFKEEVKEMIDGVLPLIRGEVE